MRLLLGVTLLCAACDSAEPQLPYYTTPDLTPQWAAGAEGKHAIAPFLLIDQNNKRVGSEEVAGKVYVASFFFTSCKQLCPRLKTQLKRVQEQFANDPNVLILSHSITPEADNVDALGRYARVNGVRPDKWHLLTGDAAAIRRLARESYFVELDDSTFSHTEVLLLVDRSGHIRGAYNGSVAYEVSRLLEDVAALVREG